MTKSIDIQYLELLQDIIDNGTTKKDRTGTGTISVFGRQLRHNMRDGFPMITTKKVHFKSIATELLWFLRGDSNIKYLVDNNVNIWNEWPYAEYCKSREKANTMIEVASKNADSYKNTPLRVSNLQEYANTMPELTQDEFIDKIKTDEQFAEKWGSIGPGYGTQWRNWHNGVKAIEKWRGDDDGHGFYTKDYHDTGIDQIQKLVDDLRYNPDSRRIMVSAWNVADIDKMALPPCHYGFQCYTRELSWEERFDIHKNYIKEDNLNLCFEFADHIKLDKLGVPRRAVSLMFNMRSCDTLLGLPFNIASYGLLLEILAKDQNMVAEELICNLGDTHLYSNHIEFAKEQIMRKPYKLPTLKINSSDWNVTSSHFGKTILTMAPIDFVIENYVAHPNWTGENKPKIAV